MDIVKLILKSEAYLQEDKSMNQETLYRVIIKNPKKMTPDELAFMLRHSDVVTQIMLIHNEAELMVEVRETGDYNYKGLIKRKTDIDPL